MKLPGPREKVSYPVECVCEVLSSTGGGGEGRDGRAAAPAASAHGARVQVPLQSRTTLHTEHGPVLSVGETSQQAHPPTAGLELSV